MKKVILILATLMSTTAFAHRIDAERIAKLMKSEGVQTIITEENYIDDGTPCGPVGKNFKIELQVKKAKYDSEKKDVVYHWETVRTTFVDQEGHYFDADVCGE